MKSIEQFIKELDVEVPPIKEFYELSKKFPIIKNLTEEEHALNYERGILLYSLVAKYKFKNILEIGTASGFSTLCMAKALDDKKIDGKIITIDPIKPEINHSKIKILTGKFNEFRSSIPKSDFLFIDGHHSYNSVKHDFFSFVDIAKEQYSILFDDYVVGEKNHVKKAVDELIIPYLNYELIKVNTKEQLEELGKQTHLDFFMCWVYDNKSLNSLYPNKTKFLNKYDRNEKLQKLRKKIPILKNYKIKFWKK